MKRLALALIILAALLPRVAVAQFFPPPPTGGQQWVPLQQLPLAAPLQNNDMFFVVQGSTFSPVRATGLQLKNFIGTITAPACSSLTPNYACLNTANSFSQPQTFSQITGYAANIRSQAGTSCTLGTTSLGCGGSAAGDCGTFIRFTSGADVTVTIPTTLPVGCEVAMEQVSTGHVIPTAAIGTTFNWSHGFTRSFGQYAVIGLTVVAAATAVGNGDGL